MNVHRQAHTVPWHEAPGPPSVLAYMAHFLPPSVVSPVRTTDRNCTVITQSQNLTSPDAMTQILVEYFQSADFDATMQIPLSAVKHALKQFSREILGLTKVQIISIMSETQPDANGLVSYVEFASTASRMIYAMIDSSNQASRIQGIDLLARTSTAELLHGLDESTVLEIISEAFTRADTDGNGYLDKTEMVEVITSFASSDLALTEQEITALVSAVDEDEDGKVTYSELADFMLDVLKHLSKEEYIRSRAFGAEVEAMEAEMVAAGAVEDDEEEEEDEEALADPVAEGHQDAEGELEPEAAHAGEDTAEHPLIQI